MLVIVMIGMVRPIQKLVFTNLPLLMQLVVIQQLHLTLRLISPQVSHKMSLRVIAMSGMVKRIQKVVFTLTLRLILMVVIQQ